MLYTYLSMPDKEESKTRKRMVVEEVAVAETSKNEEETVEPQILDEAAKVSSTELISEDKVQLSEETTTKAKKQISPVVWIIIPGIFLLGAILGGIFFYQKGINKGEVETPNSTSVSTPTPTATASPSATIDLTKYTISIFNGSGIAGEAGRAKTLLTTAGFKVGTTGNAATYDYTKTIIKAKNTVDTAFVSALSTALGKSYSVDSALTLASSSADTIQVVIGSSKAQ